jgi:hypothetical protein
LEHSRVGREITQVRLGRVLSHALSSPLFSRQRRRDYACTQPDGVEQRAVRCAV